MAILTRFICTLGLLAGCDASSPDREVDAHVPLDAQVAGDASAPFAAVPGGGPSGGPLAGTLDVQVIDGANQPIAGASIRTGTREARSNGAGYARLDGLSGETVQVRAAAAGFVPSSWLGVGAAQLTIPLLPVQDSVVPGARARVRVAGLSALPVRDDGGTYLLRLLASLPLDLEGFDPAHLDSAPESSVCRFAAGELDACTVEVETRVGPQRLYGVVEAVNQAGERLEPAALFVSAELELAAGLNDLTSPLSLLAASDLLRVAMLPVLPPVGGAKVVGVPGMKLAGGIIVFPSSEQVLLPRSGGALGEGSYWYISEATYTDADGDALRLRVARRGLDGDQLAPDPWPAVSARPVLDAGALKFATIEAGVRRVQLRARDGKPVLDAVMLGDATTLELAQGAASAHIVETFAPFDPLAFALPDVAAEALQRVERVSLLVEP
jgi:hypothetical protein